MRLLLLCLMLLALPARAQDVCADLARQVSEGKLAALRAGDLSAPHDSPDRETVIALIGAEQYARSFRDDYAIERQRLDVDGDGERDHVFLQVTGADLCPHLTVYGGRQARFLAAAGSDKWCGWTPFFYTAAGAAHLVADDNNGALDVARHVPGLGFQKLCHIQVAWTGVPEIDPSDCQDGLCLTAAHAAGAALREPMAVQGGRPGTLDFVRDGKTYRTEGGLYVDLDNDGFEEYVKPGRGAQNQLYMEIFAKQGEAFRDVDPAQRWPGFEEISESRLWLPFFDGEKLDFIRAGGRTLLLAVNKDRTDGGFRDRRAYRLGLWAIENGATIPLGTLLATDRPSVKVVPCSGACGLPGE